MIGCKALIHTYQALQLFLSPYFSAIGLKPLFPSVTRGQTQKDLILLPSAFCPLPSAFVDDLGRLALGTVH